MRTSTVLLVLATLLGTAQISADTFLDENWYLSPMISFIDDDKDRDVDDGLSGLHFAIGKELSAASSVELNTVFAFHSASGFDADQDQWGLGVDYIRRFTNTEYFKPYVLVGAGFISTISENPRRDDDSGFMASLGAGVLTPLNWFDLSLRTELRLRTDSSAGTNRDVMLSFGVQRSMKQRTTPVFDSDGDGVNDSEDRCEGTTGAKVDAYGCARK